MIQATSTCVTAKVSHALRNQDNHIHEISCYTSVIPIFDNSREVIIENIIKNSLNLTFADFDENEQLIQVSFGEEDLKRLVVVCERALKKTKLLEKQYKSDQKPLVIYRTHA